MENPNFLKQKYNLHASPEAEQAAKRKEARTGEKVPQNPAAKIQNYLERLKELTDREDPAERERGIETLKRALYIRHVIRPKEIPQSYWDTQKRLAREQGHGDVEITDDLKRQHAEIIVSDQRKSLDTWVDYLTSPDATYPDWLKYYAMRSVLNIGEYDKERKAFSKRRKDTVKPFPDLNREALAYVLDAIEKKYQKKDINLAALEAEEKEEFEKLLQGENFAKLYAWAIDKVTPASTERLANTKGKWIKYNQNSDHVPLVESLQGHGTGWCTAGESTAQTQLQGGDFYVYYSEDENGEPTIPRAAIRMQGNQIAEVRGVAADQNLDPHIGDVVKKKMQEFPDGEIYEKKANGMKRLTTIDNKTKQGQELTKDELIFLYEIDAPIQGFGYQKDPRIQEIRDQRDSKADAPVVLDCEPNQIAWSQDQINENTKAYIGPLFSGIFTELQHLENIYTSFPEGKIRRDNIKLDVETAEEYEAELKKKKINISDYAKSMMEKKKEFEILKKPELIDLVRLKVGDLGIPKQYPTTDDIWRRIEELGLELCPPEVGPAYRLKYTDQPLREWLRIGMKQISDSDGLPRVFCLGRNGGGLWLSGSWAEPTSEWSPGNEFVFRLRKLET